MLDSRETAIDRLLQSYESYYDIERYVGPDVETDFPVVARCEYYERTEKFFLTRKVELWSAQNEEFIYLLEFPHLTLELFEKWRDWVNTDGMDRLHVGPGHMSSFITPVFVCDTCDPEAKKALEECRISKSFRFSLYGWMEYRVLLVEVEESRVSANASGKRAVKMVKDILGLVPRKHKLKGD